MQLEATRAAVQVEGISPPSCPAQPLQPLAHRATTADPRRSLFLSRITHGCIPGTAVRGNTEKNTNKKHGGCFPSLRGFISQFSFGKMTSGRAGTAFHTRKVKLCESSQFLTGMNGSDHKHVNSHPWSVFQVVFGHMKFLSKGGIVEQQFGKNQHLTNNHHRES